MFLVTLKFQDRNMPDMRQKEASATSALVTVSSWTKRFADVKCVYLDDETAQERHVYTPGDGYLFTVPLPA